MRKVRCEVETFDPRRFKQDIRAWLRGDKPSVLTVLGCFQRKGFTKWANRIARLEVLNELYRGYGVLPSDVLNILGIHVFDNLSRKEILSGAWVGLSDPKHKEIEESLQLSELVTRLRNRRSRDGLIKPLEAADKTLRKLGYRANEVALFARRVQELPPGPRHRPAGLALRNCAHELAALFKHCAGRSLHRYVGELVCAAFGKDTAWSFEEMAKRLLKAKPRKIPGVFALFGVTFEGTTVTLSSQTTTTFDLAAARHPGFPIGDGTIVQDKSNMHDTLIAVLNSPNFRVPLTEDEMDKIVEEDYLRTTGKLKDH
jgi:hypothetical protein